MTEIFPENARFHVVQGLLQYDQGDHDTAFRTFQRALDADTSCALALEMTAVIHLKRKEYSQTLSYSRKLAGRPGESAAAAAVHGTVAGQLGFMDEAMRAYERAARKDPRRADLMEQLGRLALLQGEFRRAEHAFREALRREPGSVRAGKGLAVAIWQPLRRKPATWADRAVRARLVEALRLMESLPLEGDVGRQLRPMREELRAALGHSQGAAGQGAE